MRWLIVLAAVIVLFALVGWITFNLNRERPGVHLEVDEIRRDTGEVIREGRELLRQDAPEEEQQEQRAPDASQP